MKGTHNSRVVREEVSSPALPVTKAWKMPAGQGGSSRERATDPAAPRHAALCTAYPASGKRAAEDIVSPQWLNVWKFFRPDEV